MCPPHLELSSNQSVEPLLFIIIITIINMISVTITTLIRIKPECVELVMEKTAVGDWFLLYLLGQNIDHIVFKVTSQTLINGVSENPICLKTLKIVRILCKVWWRIKMKIKL